MVTDTQASADADRRYRSGVLLALGAGLLFGTYGVFFRLVEDGSVWHILLYRVIALIAVPLVYLIIRYGVEDAIKAGEVKRVLEGDAVEHEDHLRRVPAAGVEGGQHVAVIAILHHEVEMVCGFLDGVELDDVRVVAGLQDLDFVLEEFVELACIARGVPLMVSRLMALIATSCLVC